MLPRVPVADQGAREAMERDVAYHKYYSKVADAQKATDAKVDQIGTTQQSTFTILQNLSAKMGSMSAAQQSMADAAKAKD